MSDLVGNPEDRFSHNKAHIRSRGDSIDVGFQLMGEFIFILAHGVQRRMISVDNFFVFLRILFFALLLLFVT